jgi:hypothetical protein
MEISWTGKNLNRQKVTTMQSRSLSQPARQTGTCWCSRNGREWVDFYREFSSVVGLAAADFAPNIFKVLLQPQMEKYRCLWCKSSSNHNILYFRCIRR